MLCIRAKVKPSSIAGEGLFTLESFPKGKIVGILTFANPKDRIVSEEVFLQEYENSDIFFQHTSVRLIGHYYIVGYDEKVPDDYINHSNSPNLLYHCGILIAVRDIESGEELTLDYRYFIPEGEREDFECDGEPIIGWSGKEALRRSALKLIEILEDVDNLS